MGEIYGYNKDWHFSTVTGYPGQQVSEIVGIGYRIKITVEKNQTHRLKAAELDLPKRLFDEIESCASAQAAKR